MARIELPIESLPIGRPVRLECGDVGIVIVRRSDTELFAFPDVCPHAGWRLSEGELVEGRLECPGHGMQFDLATGRCIDVDSHCLEPLEVSRLENRVIVMLNRDRERTKGAADALTPFSSIFSPHC